MEGRGKLVVERTGGKSRVTTCFSEYPLKFIVPSKVGPSSTDAVWIYTLTYGGGIVSGDSISCQIVVQDGCTAVLTTQASTKVYKSIESRCSQQLLEARLGRDALLAVIPDPVTCFSTARYSQKQVFHVLPESNLVIVDWITSGRHESGEKWDFGLYKSTNHIITDDDHHHHYQPIFLDSILLEQGSIGSIVDLMHGYQVMGMLILFGPKLKEIQTQVQHNVKEIMSGKLHMPYTTSSGAQQRPQSDGHLTKPSLVASSSIFGTKGTGLVVRIAAMTTESVYKFLNEQLAGLEPYIGVSPYH